MNARKHARPTTEAWKAPEDEELVGTAVTMSATSRAVVLYGEDGAGQEELARSVAHRLATNRGPIELSWPPAREESAILHGIAESPPFHTPIILIPDIATIEKSSVAVVAKLVLRGDAIVVAAGSGKEQVAGSSLAQLIKLEYLRVGPLHPRSASSYVESGLGGPVSAHAARVICEAGAGNREKMAKIVEDWLESSFLVRHDGVWVICGENPPAGPRLIREWQNRRAVMDDSVRDVVEILALAGEVPLSLLQRACGPVAVDAVYEAGLLTLGSTGQEARLRGGVSHDAVASLVPPGRSRELHDRVESEAQGGSFRLHDPRFVAWQTRHGVNVAEERLLDAAEQLLVTGRLTEAIDLIPNDPVDVKRARVLKIGAYLAQRGPWQSSVEECMPLLQARDEGMDLPWGFTWMWQQMTHGELVMSGNVQDGVEADRELVCMLEDSDLTPVFIRRARNGLCDIEMLAGEWSQAAATLAGGWNDDSGGPGVEEIVCRARIHVVTGGFDECVTLLRREIPQMRILGRDDLLPLAMSLLAVSLAGTGRRGDALETLAATNASGVAANSLAGVVDDAGKVGAGLAAKESRGAAWATGYFSAQALGMLGRARQAVDLLVGLADRDRELGNRAQELLALSAALQLGHEPAVARLEAVAERVDGRFARACLDVVRGIRDGDASALEQGAAMAGAIGQHSLADFARAQGGKDREAGRLPDFFQYSPGRAVLTRRQKQIAERVLLGETNAAIASSIGISVRTVESHVYAIYTKMNVSNRADLRAALHDIPPAKQAFPRTT